MNKRFTFVDYTKAFGIISVVLGHLFAMVAVNDPNYYMVMAVKIMSVYELAIFFIVSGFLLEQKGTENTKIGEYTIKRIKKLVPPYVLFSFLYLITGFGLEPMIQSATGYGMSVLWFIPTLFLAEIVYLLVQKIRIKWLAAGVSAVLAVAACLLGVYVQGVEQGTWIANSTWLRIIGYLIIVVLRSLVGQFFVCVGAVWQRYFFGRKKKWTAVTAALCLLAGGYGCKFIKTVDWRVMNIEKPLVWLVVASVMSVGIMSFFYLLENCHLWLLREIGRESLVIMCTHLAFGIMPACISLGYEASALSPHAKKYIFWCVVILSLSLVELILILLKRYTVKFLQRVKEKRK